MATITVSGFATCPYLQKAIQVANDMVQHGMFSVLDDQTQPDRDAYKAWLAQQSDLFPANLVAQQVRAL